MMSETQNSIQTTDVQAQQDGQDAAAEQSAADSTLTSREAFEAEVVPLLSLLNAKCQQHNIAVMTLIGIQGETAENDQREQEILMHVTPYQSGMVPKPIHDCLTMLDAQLREIGDAGAPA